jgi:low affinity Fe/Cu permease
VTAMTTAPAAPASGQKRESAFLRVADYVSAAMGRPTNIIIWLVAVVAWTAVFAFGGPHIAGGTWLPRWFTSQGFNFPLNLATTVAELFIGFLVAAASNRSERNLETTLDRIRHQGAEIARLDTSLGDAMTLDTELSRQVKELLEQNTELTRTVEKLTRQVHAVVCAVTPDASQAGPGNGE